MRRLRHYLILGLIFVSAVGNAVILFSTSDPTANTVEPTGKLAGSGWQYQGQWGAFLGTPIAPHFFITAKHIGGSVGEAFLFRGQAHRAVQFFDDPETDLRLWRVCEVFPDFAPLSTNRNEAGGRIVVFGRGTQRGEPVLLNDQLRGWRWGAADSIQRWGENVVSKFVTADGVESAASAAEAVLLAASFDQDEGLNEAHLSVGDSGGGAFLRDGDKWKLAGVHFSVDGPFNLGEQGAGFLAALFDARDFHLREGDAWILPAQSLQPQPSAFYSTRIAPRVDWIQSVLQAGHLAWPVVQSALAASGPFTHEPLARLDWVSRRVAVPLVSEARFFRLISCERVRLAKTSLSGQELVFEYTAE